MNENVHICCSAKTGTTQKGAISGVAESETPVSNQLFDLLQVTLLGRMGIIMVSTS